MDWNEIRVGMEVAVELQCMGLLTVPELSKTREVRMK